MRSTVKVIELILGLKDTNLSITAC